MEVVARPATADDLPDVGMLAETVIHELTAHRGGAVWSRRSARPIPPHDSLEQDLRASWAHVVVGTIDGVVVGYGVVRIETMADGGRLGVVHDLYTLAGARGVGVGEDMMNALLDWCRSEGCFGVDSLALPGDRATKNFFESFGLVARAIVVHRPLSES